MARFHRAHADEHHQIRYMCFLKEASKKSPSAYFQELVLDMISVLLEGGSGGLKIRSRRIHE
jgi:hypothetical protein